MSSDPEIPEVPPPAAAQPEGEPVTVTALSCDIVGSTTIAERIGAERMAEVIDDFLRLTAEEVRRFGGRVTQFGGDGFIALFGGPVADEDHAHRAALAAWAILSRLGERAGEDAGGRGDLEVRVGLNTGEVAAGDTLELATGLQAIAEPGSVYLSDTTLRAARDGVSTRPVGIREAKGRPAMLVHRLVGVRPPRPGLAGEGTPEAIDPATPAGAHLEGERKTITALFCTIDGPLRIDDFLPSAIEDVERFGGSVTQPLGDGFLALFGAPVAHEDHAHRAALAAWAILARREGGGEGGVPEVRVGLNTGEVVAGPIARAAEAEYTAIGDTLNLASRLQAMAEPASVYLSEATARAGGDAVSTQPVGLRAVKGRREPVMVHRLVGVRPGRLMRGGRLTSEIVGRDDALERLASVVGRLGAGAGGVVLVSGEAGVGKTRLLAEARRRAGDAARWLEGQTLSFGRAMGYWPLLEMIRSDCSIDEEDGEERSLEKLRERLVRLCGAEADEMFAPLAAILGLSPGGDAQARMERLDGLAVRALVNRSTRRLFSAIAAERPVVLVFEDLHWVDDSSSQLIEHLLPLVRDEPIAIVCASRPDNNGAMNGIRDAARTGGQEAPVEIALSALPAADGAALVRNLVGSDALPARDVNALVARAGGNPFFLEELVRSLISSGALAEGAPGRRQPARRIRVDELPTTVEGVIAARIDSLGDAPKDLLNVAAVVGRTFLGTVLQDVSQRPGSLDDSLDALVAGDLIHQRRREGGPEYAFTHALVQQVAYESVLVRRRRSLHGRVGECIERLFPDRLEEFYGLLAHHFAQAEDWEKAHEYLQKAAREANSVAADSEALESYRRALDAYGRAFGDRWDPVERAGLERGMGEALFRLGRHEEAVDHLLEAFRHLGVSYPAPGRETGLAILREAARQLAHRMLPVPRSRGATPEPAVVERLRLCTSMGWIDYFMDPERFILDVLLLLNLAERHGIPSGVAAGSSYVSFMLAHVPLKRAAAGYGRRALRLSEEAGDPLATGFSHMAAGFRHQYWGSWGDAIAHFRRSADAYWTAGDLRGWGAASGMHFWALRQQGAFSDALAVNHRMQRVGEEASDPEIVAFALHGQAQVAWRVGDLERSTELCERTIELYRAVPSTLNTVQALAELATCRLRQGRVSEALDLLTESTELIERYKFRGFSVIATPIALAEVHLRIAEDAWGSVRESVLDQARGAVRTAFKHSRVACEGVPPALRVQGTHQWLSGRRDAAGRTWSKGADMASAFGARYDRARIDLEAGLRLQDRQRLARAEAELSAMGVVTDAARAREALASV